MRRRQFLAFAAAAAAFPRFAIAQQARKVPKVALCSSAIPASAMVIGGDVNWSALLQTLTAKGFVEGRTVTYERYTAPAAEVAVTILASKPDAIFWGGASMAASVALMLNKTIPMIAFVPDMLAQGLVSNIARPSGNITGVSVNAAPEIYSKIVSLLHETVPNAKTVAYLSGGTAGRVPPDRQALLDIASSTATKRGVSLVPVIVEAPGSDALFAQAFKEVAAIRADAIQLGAEVTVQFFSATVASLAIAAKLPSISPYDQFAPAGGLLGYAPDYVAMSRQCGEYIALVLNGTKPGDLPGLQPTVYNFVVNLKTAKAIGIELPTSILVQATKVIE